MFLCHVTIRVLSNYKMVYTFYPVDDIDGYVWALKREGFRSDKEIEEIRKKHQDARDAIDKKVDKFQRERRFKIMNKNLKSFCGHDCDSVSIHLKMKIGSNGKVKVKLNFPFAELEAWVQRWDTLKPPMKLMLRCLKYAGASREFLENLMRLQNE